MTKEEIIVFLQKLTGAILNQANVHQMVALQFGAQGFSKLEAKYLDHAQEERDFAQVFINRILDLGGQLQLQATEEQNLPKTPKEWLEIDLETSRKGFEELSPYLKGLAEDVTTYDLFKDYVKDEEEDLYWTEGQLDLIEAIGYQNWLVQQL